MPPRPPPQEHTYAPYVCIGCPREMARWAARLSFHTTSSMSVVEEMATLARQRYGRQLQLGADWQQAIQWEGWEAFQPVAGDQGPLVTLVSKPSLARGWCRCLPRIKSWGLGDGHWDDVPGGVITTDMMMADGSLIVQLLRLLGYMRTARWVGKRAGVLAAWHAAWPAKYLQLVLSKHLGLPRPLVILQVHRLDQVTGMSQAALLSDTLPLVDKVRHECACSPLLGFQDG